MIQFKVPNVFLTPQSISSSTEANDQSIDLLEQTSEMPMHICNSDFIPNTGELNTKLANLLDIYPRVIDYLDISEVTKIAI